MSSDLCYFTFPFLKRTKRELNQPNPRPMSTASMINGLGTELPALLVLIEHSAVANGYIVTAQSLVE